MPTVLDDLAALLSDGFEVEDIRTGRRSIHVRLRRGRLRVAVVLSREDAAAMLDRFRLKA